MGESKLNQFDLFIFYPSRRGGRGGRGEGVGGVDVCNRVFSLLNLHEDVRIWFPETEGS